MLVSRLHFIYPVWHVFCSTINVSIVSKLSLVVIPPSGKPITGAELAGLLQVLVDAANEGSLADVSILLVSVFLIQCHSNFDHAINEAGNLEEGFCTDYFS